MLLALLLSPELLLLECFLLGYLLRAFTHLHVSLGAACVAGPGRGHAVALLATW